MGEENANPNFGVRDQLNLMRQIVDATKSRIVEELQKDNRDLPLTWSQLISMLSPRYWREILGSTLISPTMPQATDGSYCQWSIYNVIAEINSRVGSPRSREYKKFKLFCEDLLWILGFFDLYEEPDYQEQLRNYLNRAFLAGNDIVGLEGSQNRDVLRSTITRTTGMPQVWSDTQAGLRGDQVPQKSKKGQPKTHRESLAPPQQPALPPS